MKRVFRSFSYAHETVGVVLLTFSLFFFIGSPQIFAADAQEAESIISTVCSTCHKFEGKAKSRFNLKAPDLMWGGSKYQRDWLIGWLTGKEPMLYAKSYRWDQTQHPEQHMTVSKTGS